MKKAIVKLAAITFGISLFLVSCNKSPASKENDVQDAKEDLVEAKQDLNEAQQDSINDFNTFKETIDLKIAENKKTIQELKSKNNKKGKSERQAAEIEINKLEKRNTELELRIQNYEQGSAEKWTLFKAEVNKEMDELGKSISSMAQRNMKK